MMRIKWLTYAVLAVLFTGPIFPLLLSAADLYSDALESDPVQIQSVTPDANT